ncbi:hypothetical protein ACWY4P_51745 [Streptomyces sp. LZ34]
MDFRITADEESVLFLIIAHLDASDAPSVDELSQEAGRSAARDVASLRSKGWILMREIDDRHSVIGLSPMALVAVRNLRYGRRET